MMRVTIFKYLELTKYNVFRLYFFGSAMMLLSSRHQSNND